MGLDPHMNICVCVCLCVCVCVYICTYIYLYYIHLTHAWKCRQLKKNTNGTHLSAEFVDWHFLNVHSWQLLQKEFFLKPGYLSFLEALCSVSDHAIKQQQIRVFELFIQKHKNLLFQVRLSSRALSNTRLRFLSGDNFFIDLESIRKVEGPPTVNCMLGL